MKSINNFLLVFLMAFLASCGEASDPSDDPSFSSDTCGNGHSAHFEFQVADGDSYIMVHNDKTTVMCLEQSNGALTSASLSMGWFLDESSDDDFYSAVGLFIQNLSVGTYEFNREEEDEQLQLIRSSSSGNFRYSSTELTLEVLEVERGIGGFFTPIRANFSGTFEYDHDGITEEVEVSGSFCSQGLYVG